MLTTSDNDTRTARVPTPLPSNHDYEGMVSLGDFIIVNLQSGKRRGYWVALVRYHDAVWALIEIFTF